MSAGDERAETRPLDELEQATPAESAADPAETRAMTGMRSAPDPLEAAPEVRRRPSRLVTRLAVGGGTLLLGAAAGWALEALIAGVLGAGLWYQWAALAGSALLLLAVLALAARELRALARLQRLSDLQRRAAAVDELPPGGGAALVREFEALYRDRPELEWALAEVRDRDGAQDGRAALNAFDRQVLARLDAQATRAIAGAVRRAGAATAISPFPVLDVAVAAVIDLRLVATLARIYGGRPGGLATLRLLRLAFANVLAAGTLDAVEDTLGDAVGSGLAARLSSRAGSALINGLLTARLGLAATDACRPVPWPEGRRPRARSFVRRALLGERA